MGYFWVREKNRPISDGYGIHATSPDKAALYFVSYHYDLEEEAQVTVTVSREKNKTSQDYIVRRPGLEVSEA